MRIVVDTREKPRAIVRIMNTFREEGIDVVRDVTDDPEYKNKRIAGLF